MHYTKIFAELVDAILGGRATVSEETCYVSFTNNCPRAEYHRILINGAQTKMLTGYSKRDNELVVVLSEDNPNTYWYMKRNPDTNSWQMNALFSDVLLTSRIKVATELFLALKEF